MTSHVRVFDIVRQFHSGHFVSFVKFFTSRCPSTNVSRTIYGNRAWARQICWTWHTLSPQSNVRTRANLVLLSSPRNAKSKAFIFNEQSHTSGKVLMKAQCRHHFLIPLANSYRIIDSFTSVIYTGSTSGSLN